MQTESGVALPAGLCSTATLFMTGSRLPRGTRRLPNQEAVSSSGMVILRATQRFVGQLLDSAATPASISKPVICFAQARAILLSSRALPVAAALQMKPGALGELQCGAGVGDAT